MKNLIEKERDRCLKILTLSNSELLLMAGEMTAQEIRTVQAILRALREKVRHG